MHKLKWVYILGFALAGPGFIGLVGLLNWLLGPQLMAAVVVGGLTVGGMAFLGYVFWLADSQHS